MNLDLLFAEVPIVTWDSCKESYDIYLDEAMICAGTTEKDACQVIVLVFFTILFIYYSREILVDL